MREDRLADGRHVVFPSFVETSSQTERSFEEGDGPFNSCAKPLSKTKQRIMFSLAFLKRSSTFLADRDRGDLVLQTLYDRHAFVVALS